MLRALFASHNALTALPDRLLTQPSRLEVLHLPHNRLQALPPPRKPLNIVHMTLQDNALTALPTSFFLNTEKYGKIFHYRAHCIRRSSVKVYGSLKRYRNLKYLLELDLELFHFIYQYIILCKVYRTSNMAEYFCDIRAITCSKNRAGRIVRSIE